MYNAVPTSCQDLRRLMRMPLHVHTHLTVSLYLIIQLCSLPVPNGQSTVRISGYDITHVRRKVHATRITGDHVATKHFFTLPPEVGVRLHDFDLVVHWLEGQVATVPGKGHWRHGVLLGICQVLEVNGNIPFPGSNTLVVRCTYETFVVIYKCNCVDST